MPWAVLFKNNSPCPRKTLIRHLRLFRKSPGESFFRILSDLLGLFPSEKRIRLTERILRLPESALEEMSRSADPGERRTARLLRIRKIFNVQLCQGFTDPLAAIRIDTARFANGERDRLYNRLIRLIRDDPDSCVRAAAGQRLRNSFADLYSLNTDSLPPLSRMIILDALDGRYTTDRMTAGRMLGGTKEEALRASRCLRKWESGRTFWNN